MNLTNLRIHRLKFRFIAGILAVGLELTLVIACNFVLGCLTLRVYISAEDIETPRIQIPKESRC